MRVAWFQLGTATGAVVFALLTSAPIQAADESGFTAVAAEELDKRSKQPQKKGLSDSRVRVMVTYAFSLIPEATAGADGKSVPVDKSDFNTFVIPNDDARQVIRAATRSAYAEVCGLLELAEANLKALMTAESKRGRTREQMLMVEALHLFALSYFTGNAKFTRSADSGDPEGAEGASEGAGDAEVVEAAPPPPKCPPEQKQRVESAIKAYVASVPAN